MLGARRSGPAPGRSTDGSEAMNRTFNTTLPGEERTGTGEPDEPGSAGDADVPPEPADTANATGPDACVDIVDETEGERSDVDAAWLRSRAAGCPCAVDRKPDFV